MMVKRGKMHLGLLLSLVLLLQIYSSEAACPSTGCTNGFCRDGSCQCQPNFSGSDCSIPFETCPDGDRTCFNGSVCVQNNRKDPMTRTFKYHCDCSKAYGLSAFAGHQCEHAATSVCEVGVASSAYAFCTNDGKCLESVVSGRPHVGCNCPPDYEGMHCQYLLGTAPEGQAGSSNPDTRSTKERGVRTFFIFMIVVVCMVLGVSMGLMIRHVRTMRELDDGQFSDLDLSETPAYTGHATGADLELKADGSSSMMVSSQQGSEAEPAAEDDTPHFT